jgi:hypothetical protein
VRHTLRAILGRMADGPPKNLSALAQDALLEAFRSYSELDMFVDLQLAANLANFSPVGATLEYTVLIFIRWCRTEGRFDELVRALSPRYTHLPKVRELYESVFPNAQPVAAAAGGARRSAHLPCCLGVDTVFIDRENLRRAIEDVENHRGSNVLVIKGARHSGKSFSYRLIKHLAPRYKYRLVWLDLREELTPGSGPDALVRALLHQMGLDTRGLPEQGQCTGERWAQELANWLVGVVQTHQANNRWWIVVDGFSDCFVPMEVRTVLLRIAGKVAAVLPNIRLGLLGYDEVITRPLCDEIRTESVAPIGLDELKGFFRQAFQEHEQIADERVIDTIVERVLDAYREVPEGHPEALRILHDLVRDAVHSLLVADRGAA